MSMNKPPYNRPPSGPWRDAGDGPGRTPAPLVFRRRRAPVDDSDRLIKIAAAVIVIAIALVVGAHFREKARLQEHLLAVQAQEKARILATQVATHQAGLERQRAVQIEQATRNQRQLYRCVDGNGATSIQNAPCPPSSSVTWAASIPVESPEQASLRQQAWNRQQAEARLRQEEARFAQATGAENASRTYYPASANVAPSGRCQSAKNARDEAYRIAGNNRTFEMIRRWNDIVYDACKDV